MGLGLSFICIDVGQGNSTRGPEEFVRNEALSNFLRNYSGSRVEFPCPIAILFLAHFHSELLGQFRESDLGCNTQYSMMT